MKENQMTDRKMIVPALAGVLGMGAIATAAEPTAAELREQIEALQSKVAKIEAKEASAAQQQATMQSVLNDAERRSQLLQSGGMTAGWNGKEFALSSADGAFKMVPYFQFQFRGIANWADEAQADGDDNTESGFEIRRMKAGLKGNAFAKELSYDFNLAVNRNSGTPTLEKAFVQYAFSDEMALKIGQWKDNVFHEETISSSKQIAVDRSLVNEELGGGNTDYVQGVALVYSSEAIAGEFALHDGANSDNTNYLDQDDANYGASARVEYKVFGDWKSYSDFTALKNKEDLLVIGAGLNYTEGGDDKAVFHTIDAQYEVGQLGIYAAYVATWADDGADDEYSWGAIGQVAYLIDENWEVFGRYGFLEEDSINEITFGANYYWHGHNAKATLDVVVLPDGSPSDSGLGYVASDDLQVVIRGQFQLAL
jgi:hypothetical protein